MSIIATPNFGIIPTASAGHPNEPAGAILLNSVPMYLGDFYEQGWQNETPAQPWADLPWTSPGPYMNWGTTVTDGTAPVNPTQIGRFEINPSNASYGPNYDNGSCYHYGDSIEELLSYDTYKRDSWSKYYVSHWFKLGDGYRIIPAHLKLFSIRSQTQFGWNIAITKNYNDPDAWGTATLAPFRMNIYLSGNPSHNDYGTYNIQYDTWYHIEVVLDNVNKRHEMWQNGVKIIDQTVSTSSWPADSRIGELWWVWTYGGAVGCTANPPVLDRTMYSYHDEFYVSCVP